MDNGENGELNHDMAEYLSVVDVVNAILDYQEVLVGVALNPAPGQPRAAARERIEGCKAILNLIGDKMPLKQREVFEVAVGARYRAAVTVLSMGGGK